MKLPLGLYMSIGILLAGIVEWVHRDGWYSFLYLIIFFCFPIFIIGISLYIGLVFTGKRNT